MTTRDDQVHDLAKEVAKQFARDNSRKQKMLQRSPHLARAMDAEEIAGMSSRELAERELSELGIKPDGRSVEEQLLDAHHAGRQFARDGNRVPGNGDNRSIGSAHDTLEGTGVDQFFANLSHSAQDAADGGIESILNNYLKE